ncbi:MAG TPA: hypothetical protein VMF59_09730 [Bacteroidota bacterium]|nr:hypothetical protein [Bacteroidota bacterium]
MLKNISLHVPAFIAGLLLAGCISTGDIRTYGDLASARGESIRLVTVDTTVYDLESFTFNDSLLRGEGERCVGGRWQRYSGEIPLSTIVYLHTRNVNVAGSVICAGLLGIVVEATLQRPLDSGMSVYRRMGGDGMP